MFENAILLNPKSPEAFVGRGKAEIKYYLPEEEKTDFGFDDKIYERLRIKYSKQ